MPTVNVSCLDITMQTVSDTDAVEVNRILRDAATSGPLKGLLAYTELPHASCDFNHDPHSAIVDASQTRVSGPRLMNILAWFDNESGVCQPNAGRRRTLSANSLSKTLASGIATHDRVEDDRPRS